MDGLCATAWALMVENGFNPFELGGGWFPDTLTLRDNPARARTVRPILRLADLQVPFGQNAS